MEGFGLLLAALTNNFLSFFSRFSGLSISSLLSTDDVVLLVSSSHDLQFTLVWFAAKCEAVEMRISASKSGAIILNWQKVPTLGQEQIAPQSGEV